MKIESLEICLFSLPIKESAIFDFILGVSLKDEVLNIMLVQKQTCAGQRTQFKAFVAIGDYNRHVGLGVVFQGGSHCHPWGHNSGQALHHPCAGAWLLGQQDCQAPHRPLQGDWPLRLYADVPRSPSPSRGTGIVLAPVPKKLMMMAGIDDCYTSARGCAATLGNFTKTTFDATSKKCIC